MDELPDLQSDADVDALMGRLRAKLAPPSAASTRPAIAVGPAPPAADPLADLVAAHDGLVATMVRAMEAIVETLDELHSTAEGPAIAVAPSKPPGPARRTRAAVPRRSRTGRGRSR